ncbi:flagellar hook-length control protein FliK [Clostridium minihomine]|uniref:flagellar hook-length control protein FliK n=1 Tax=Clostridium minihomine TaxID=2045012 RepID=UPI000C78A3A9|nr:flagellar hook-length control protein FliK [Clostridium minihomine]
MIQQVSVQRLDLLQAPSQPAQKSEDTSFETALQKAQTSFKEKDGKEQSQNNEPLLDTASQIPDDTLLSAALWINPALFAVPQEVTMVSTEDGSGLAMIMPVKDSAVQAGNGLLQNTESPVTVPSQFSAVSLEEAVTAPVFVPEQQQTQQNALTLEPLGVKPMGQDELQSSEVSVSAKRQGTEVLQPSSDAPVSADKGTQADGKTQTMDSKTEAMPMNSIPTVSAASQGQQSGEKSFAQSQNTSESSSAGKETNAETQPTVTLPVWQHNLASAVSRAQTTSHVSSGTVSHLTQQLAKNYRAGINQFQMELFPHNLGKVSVSMKVEQGLLVVDILADSPRTQSLLASGSSEIRSLLESAVGQPVQIAQTAQEAPQYYEGQGNQSEEQGQAEQQEQRQNPETTEDFLTVLNQLKQQNNIL